MDSRQAMAPAASPQIVEIVRAPGATSRRVSHLGHSTPNENAITIGPEISVLQCGHVRTATAHLPVRTTYINRNRRAKKDKTGLAVRQSKSFSNIKNLDSGLEGRFLQSAVKRGKRYILTDGNIQVGRVVG